MVEWNFHVADSMGAYDMIIGLDIMSFLGIDIKFSEQVITWERAEMPFKPKDATAQSRRNITLLRWPSTTPQNVLRVSWMPNTKQQT